jgi:hypothetical protein
MIGISGRPLMTGCWPDWSRLPADRECLLWFFLLAGAIGLPRIVARAPRTNTICAASAPVPDRTL